MADTEAKDSKKTDPKIKLASLKIDGKKERDGEWQPVPDLPGVQFLVRSTSFHPFVVAQAAATRKLLRKYKDEPIPEEVLAEVNGQLATEHLLLNWKGFDVDYTAEVAEEVMTDPEYREVRGHVYYCARQVGRGRVEFVDDLAKNSKRRSAGA